MKPFNFALILLISSLSWFPAAQAEVHNAGPYQVHFSAFESTFLTPEVAKTYNITRSRYNGVINISVLDTRSGNLPTEVEITGDAKNLIGHNVPLDFKEVKEGEAVYYLEQIRYSNEETFRFKLEITTPEGTYPVEFMKKFYVN
ncbi:DUF4426 domain-containing protein [Neiella marina]|uniref:DUF4426 domain-containing protein n=1 Tax=Neiella holothuriorum TaxID=2870530 RepID=A0ABS7EKA2_9GAMM|nr:DUF4426 domain-containing protein [Neiella holothuriorum]MBW8192659.1 DUF4426 domain-containing protein [Neiella holothuriorum]